MKAPSRSRSSSEFDQFRTDDIFTTDLRLEKDIPFAENLSATITSTRSTS